MPQFDIYLLDAVANRGESQDGTPSEKGEFQRWELPWERLVFDQRIDYKAADQDEVRRFRVTDERQGGPSGGAYYVVELAEGVPQGADPKKTRP